MIETRFGSLANTFKLTKNQVTQIADGNVILLRHLAFYPFVASFLDLFELIPNLSSVKLVHNLTHVVRTDVNTVIEANHEVWVFANEAGLDPDTSPEEHETYVEELIPYRLMGKGTFEITREDPRIQRFLNLPDFAQGEWSGLVAEIALAMDRAFGTIRTVHTLT